MSSAKQAAEVAARASYGRLVAILASRTHDIAAAEDALANAFVAALAAWPAAGVPVKPEAWLITAARRELMHGSRHQKVRRDALMTQLQRAEELADAPESTLADDRLKLLFVCAHPAIDESLRAPLMLQTVLGLSTEQIAAAALVAPAAMRQRLARAKLKIKDACLRFELPDPAELPGRLDDVLQAIYAAFGVAWEDWNRAQDLTEEALFLGRMLVELLPAEPEAKGLLSLMLFCEARREARRDAAGRFIPLAEQEPQRWSRSLVLEAEALLTEASSYRRFGRFQCEAAIQSVHVQRAVTGVIQYAALHQLYDLLFAAVPSVGVAVARAATLLDGGKVEQGKRALEALAEADIASYQPYWVVRARLAELEHDASGQADALRRALGLTEDAAVRLFLTEQLARHP